MEDTDDPQAGLRHGELTIPGHLLRQEVFDPVVQQVRGLSIKNCRNHHTYTILASLRCALLQVLDLIEEQTKRIDQPLHALLMVGGFSGERIARFSSRSHKRSIFIGSEYLFHKVKVRMDECLYYGRRRC